MISASGSVTGSRVLIGLSSMRQNAWTGAPMRSEPNLGNAWACLPSRNAASASSSVAVTTPCPPLPWNRTLNMVLAAFWCRAAGWVGSCGLDGGLPGVGDDRRGPGPAAGQHRQRGTRQGERAEAEGDQRGDVGDLRDLPPAVGVEQHAAQRVTLEDGGDLAGQLGVGRLGLGQRGELRIGLAAGDVADVHTEEVVGVRLGLLAG